MSDTEASLFIRACRGESVPRPPIWMMRQAGRYMPAYRKLRENVSFWQLCRTPDLACEVTMQPIEEFGFDAAILFSDIMTPLPPMGVNVEFNPGPVIDNPVETASDVEALRVFDPNEELDFVMDAVRAIRAALPPGTPLIGFAGAPFTILTYCVEGGGSKSWPKTRQMLHGEPQTAHKLLEKITDVTAAYLAAQAAAGAQAVQLFDSWAGILSPRTFREFALRHATVAIEKFRQDHKDVPVIYFVNGCAPYLDCYADSKADVLGVDWRIDLAAVREALGPKQSVQGNMDPGALYLPHDALRTEVERVLRAGGSAPGHIFNLGHGVLPTAPMEAVRLMVDTVQAWSYDD